LACEFAERPARTRPGGETPLELAAEDGCATTTDNFGMHRGRPRAGKIVAACDDFWRY
ncbi:MAG: hypothetical protein HY735_29050, partial [Verrucomicrobia bacterium]|nr:hypothetical protein [Verrucomicrobiota bacterium]